MRNESGRPHKPRTSETSRTSHSQSLKKLRLHARTIADALDKYLGRPVQTKRLALPLDMLIATLLSQNTNDRNSHQAWLNLRANFPSWEEVVQAPTSRLAKVIEVGGLKNQKAHRIKKILKVLMKQRGSFSLGFLKKKTDQDILDYLTSLDGIGTKTAACVLVFSLGRDVFPVDTHVHRLCNRLGLVSTKTPDQTFEAMKEIVPKGRAYSLHTNLIRFGRKVCKAGKPLCGQCPLYRLCQFPQKRYYAERGGDRLPARQRDVNFMLLDNVA